ncbi:glycosyltransferase family 2 protein [Flavobacteriales bacterium]|nr:glycosyltransferase family 2 protein [Flavobacteriales bacterium]
MNKEQQATVIIPCFNVEAYIIDCLDSVELQGDSVNHTYIVDNNCTDNTIAMVREWQKAHPAFSLTIAEETTPGAPAARNHPLALVKTKWVQFLDADDVLLANKISDQIKRFPDADVICAGGTHLAIDGTEQQSIPEPNIPLALMKGQAGNTCSNLFSTASVQAVQGWDESLKSSQEYDLMFRLWQSGGGFRCGYIAPGSDS